MNIHPFPARMAPELVDEKIAELPEGSHILDPMCGSGTTLRRSIDAGHSATGWDIDPLAVKMSRVRCRRYNVSRLEKELNKILLLTALRFSKNYKWRRGVGFEVPRRR